MSKVNQYFFIYVSFVHLFICLFVNFRVCSSLESARFLKDEVHLARDIDVSMFKQLNVTIVFFAFLKPEQNWRVLLENYADLLLETGLLDHVQKFHICMSTTTNKDWFTDFSTTEPASDNREALLRLKEGVDMFDAKFHQYINIIKYDLTLGNLYEFPGILKLWESASKIDNKEEATKSVFLYFHSKGMVGHGAIGKDFHPQAPMPFTRVIKPWKIVLKYFLLDDTLEKAGLECGFSCGAAMQNFFWIRGSTLQMLKRPKRSNSRYYYEHWLCHYANETLFAPMSRYNLHFDYVEFMESHNQNGWLPKYGYVSAGELAMCDSFWTVDEYRYFHGKFKHFLVEHEV